MTDWKNIVIIGASDAGHSVANEIAGKLPKDYRVVIVERNPYVVWSPGHVRQVVVPGWEEKNFQVEVTQQRIFPAGSRHRVVCPNSVEELRKTSVVLEKPFEGSTELPFEYCVIATGAQQPPPIGAEPGMSLNEFKERMRKMQQDFAKAEKILIIGGGTVGVEVAGEITTEHPGKSLTIVHPDENGLLGPTPQSKPDDQIYQAPTYGKLSTSLEKQLRSRGVEVLLGEKADLPDDVKTGHLGKMRKFKLESGKEIEADCVFISIGNKANSDIVKKADKGALSDPQDRIMVDEYFRVKASSPSSPLAGQYYALGDVSAISEWKTAVCAMRQAPALGKVLIAEVYGRKPPAYTPAPQTPIVVTLGTKGGAGVYPALGYFEVPLPGPVMCLKSNDFFAAKSFFSRFRGDEDVLFSG